MNTREGIDCATRLTAESAKKLAAAGQTFAARYLVPDTYSKALLPAEVKAISDAGMDILSVYETTASRALSGSAGGANDARSALACAEAVRQPHGSAIYFAVDFDTTSTVQLDAVEQYLKGAMSVLGDKYAVGVYGEYTVIEEMKKRAAAIYFWQTYAWSVGKRSTYADLYQYKNGQTVAGVSVDLNTQYDDAGMWSLRATAPAKLTKFSDVPAGHMYEAAIKAAYDSGEMTGYADGTFGIDKPITRGEMAVILTRLKK